MGLLKRLAFYLGLVLGLVTVAAAGTAVITYLFTGKLPSVRKTDGEKVELVLMTPDEVVALVREQVAKGSVAPQAAEAAGGENDGEA